MNTAVLFSRASDEWSTPPALYAALDAEFRFVLDAAARPDNATCAQWFGPGGVVADALAVDWADYVPAGAAIFVNPPYSGCRPFIASAAAAGRAGVVVVALVPARTDTRWWHEHVWDDGRHTWRPGVSVRFIRGRLRFGQQANSAPFPSAIVVFRPMASL